MNLPPPRLSERMRQFAADLEYAWPWERRRIISEMRVLAGQLEILEGVERAGYEGKA